MRRIVTAQVGEDRSVLADLREVDAVHGRNSVYGVWGWDEPPTRPVPVPDEPPVPASMFPPPGGLRVCVVEFPAGAGVTVGEDGTVSAEQLAAFSRLHDAVPPGGVRDSVTGMHRTDTVDIGFVLSGEIDLEQADGSSITLRPGDVLIQNAALHAWRNRADAPCAVGFVLVGVAASEERR